MENQRDEGISNLVGTTKNKSLIKNTSNHALKCSEHNSGDMENVANGLQF